MADVMRVATGIPGFDELIAGIFPGGPTQTMPLCLSGNGDLSFTNLAPDPKDIPARGLGELRFSGCGRREMAAGHENPDNLGRSGEYG